MGAVRTAARSSWLGVLVSGCVAGCAPTISTFSAIAYEQATSLKVDALGLMDLATQPYADHRVATDVLTVRLAKAGLRAPPVRLPADARVREALSNSGKRTLLGRW